MAGGIVPDGFDRGTCKWGCGASIFWALILDPITLRVQRNPRDGSKRKVPLNRVPCAEGTWLYSSTVHRGVRWIAKGELLAPAAERWQGHHATCPHAQHRRPRPVKLRGVPPRAPVPTAPVPAPDPTLF